MSNPRELERDREGNCPEMQHYRARLKAKQEERGLTVKYPKKVKATKKVKAKKDAEETKKKEKEYKTLKKGLQ